MRAIHRTLLAGRRWLVAERPRSWSQYAEVLAFAYNTQVHPSLGLSPFELVLSSPPRPLTLRPEASYEGSVKRRQMLQQFQDSIRRLTEKASHNLPRAQLQYKRNFDERVRPVGQPTTGDMVYLRREIAEQDPEGIKHRQKLQLNPTGPFRVLLSTEHNVTMLNGDEVETIAIERVVRAPNSTMNRSSELVPKAGSISNSIADGTSGEKGDGNQQQSKHKGNDNLIKRGSSSRQTISGPRLPKSGHLNSDEDSVEAMIDRILEYNERDDLFKVKWFGYPESEATDEPPGHLLYNKMVQFFCRNHRSVPAYIHDYKRGN